MSKKSPLAGTGKRMRGVVDKAREFGYRVGLSRNNHLRLVPPVDDLPVLFFASTPGDHRSPKQAMATLMRQIRAIQGRAE